MATAKDPRFLYTCVSPIQIKYFGWNETGRYFGGQEAKYLKRYGECDLALPANQYSFIKDCVYIVVSVDERIASVSGFFHVKISHEYHTTHSQRYHTQKFLKSTLKSVLIFQKRYPKTTKL